MGAILPSQDDTYGFDSSFPKFQADSPFSASTHIGPARFLTNSQSSAASLGAELDPLSWPQRLKAWLFKGRTAAKSRRETRTVRRIVRKGDYQLLRKLGAGGMGTVYLARQESLDRPVAIKMLSRSLSTRQDARDRFLQEAKAMARLDHPGILKVHATDSIDNRPFAVLEYIDGQSMQRWMNQLGRLSIADSVHVGLLAADALAHAHAQHVVHRDVKPDNILLTRNGRIRIGDFGLAAPFTCGSVRFSTAPTAGTPLFMAPEQARDGRKVDPRNDIYALGCTLFYFLTGQYPYTGSTTIELLLMKEQRDAPSPREWVPAIPEDLAAIVLRMLERDLKRRYGSCGEVAKDLALTQLASSALGFIDEAQVTLPLPQRQLAEDFPGKKRRYDGQDGQKVRSHADFSEVWYVLHHNAHGNLATARMTGAQICRAVAYDFLEKDAHVRRTRDEHFVPLSAIPQFARAISHQKARRTADDETAWSLPRTANYASLSNIENEPLPHSPADGRFKPMKWLGLQNSSEIKRRAE